MRYRHTKKASRKTNSCPLSLTHKLILKMQNQQQDEFADEYMMNEAATGKGEEEMAT